jgi:ABC-type molybdate transport system substrate-binding protein
VNNIYTILLAFLVILTPDRSTADEIRVAAASNFRDAMKALASQFEQVSEHEVILIFGSTGKQFAQIRNGAPYDAFFPQTAGARNCWNARAWPCLEAVSRTRWVGWFCGARKQAT